MPDRPALTRQQAGKAPAVSASSHSRNAEESPRRPAVFRVNRGRLIVLTDTKRVIPASTLISGFRAMHPGPRQPDLASRIGLPSGQAGLNLEPLSLVMTQVASCNQSG